MTGVDTDKVLHFNRMELICQAFSVRLQNTWGTTIPFQIPKKYLPTKINLNHIIMIPHDFNTDANVNLCLFQINYFFKVGY